MEHKLYACKVSPLSSYLKSLGIFKLIGEQLDCNVKAHWENGIMTINTNNSQADIINFFQESYSPSPILSPWSGGSGFYPNDTEVSKELNKILRTNDKRFELYRDTITKIKSLFPDLEIKNLNLETIRNFYIGNKNDKKLKIIDDLVAKINIAIGNNFTFVSSSINDIYGIIPSNLSEKLTKVVNAYFQDKRKKSKSTIVNKCRDNLSDRYIEWLDSSILVNSDNDVVFPPIAGTGGNEGRLDYSSVFISCITYALLENFENSKELLRNSIFDDQIGKLIFLPIGKFDPGKAGGYNQGNEIETKKVPNNPWDIIFMMEGILMWSNSIGRRNSISKGKIVSSFTVSSAPFGYSSSNVADYNDRMEIWAPIWKNPSFLNEIKMFFKEGRVAIRGRIARNGMDFAEAVNSLGVDRGLNGFMRYNFLKRRGESYVALPTGYHEVKYNKYVRIIGDLDRIFFNFEKTFKEIKANNDSAPISFMTVRRDIYDATYNLIVNGNEHNTVKLLRALGRAEMLMSRVRFGNEEKGTKIKNPLYGLSTEWLIKGYDNSVEFRLAASLASVRSTGEVGSFRANIEGTKPFNDWSWENGKGQFSWVGNSLQEKLTNTLYRRIFDSEKSNTHKNPFYSKLNVSLSDIAKFIEGNVDEKCIEELLFAFVLIKWDDVTAKINLKKIKEIFSYDSSQPILISRSWALLKLSFSDKITIENKDIVLKPNKRVIKLLESNKINDACDVVKIQMVKNNIIPFNVFFPNTGDGSRYSAALLFPVWKSDADKLVKMVTQKEVAIYG